MQRIRLTGRSRGVRRTCRQFGDEAGRGGSCRSSRRGPRSLVRLGGRADNGRFRVTAIRMGLFSKPSPPKPPMAKTPAGAKPSGEAERAGRVLSARELAAKASPNRSAGVAPREPGRTDESITGASLVEWSQPQAIEVAQANPGLCAVLENAALLFASGQPANARALLEQGVASDRDTKQSPLAWLALFDLLQRAGDRAAFDQLAMQYSMEFERSAPGWEEHHGAAAAAAKAPPGGGYIAIAGRLTQASAPQLEGLRAGRREASAAGAARPGRGHRLRRRGRGAAREHARLGAAGADPPGHRAGGQAQGGARSVREGRAGGRRGTVAALARAAAVGARAGGLRRSRDRVRDGLRALAALVGAAAEAGGAGRGGPRVRRSRARRALRRTPWHSAARSSATRDRSLRSSPNSPTAGTSIPIDMSDVERIDFVCAGALLNAVNRIETQRRSVQIVGATPIIRALLLLIGLSPRHFVKKVA